MADILYEIPPSFSGKVSHLGLGLVSAVFGLLIAGFIGWSALYGTLSGLTLIILSLPALFFMAVSWFVLRFGVDYVQGIRIYSTGLAVCFPMKRNPGKTEKLRSFSDLRHLYFEETMEIHRVGNRVKEIRIYRIQAETTGREEKELLIELLNLPVRDVLKFREFPGFLVKQQLFLSDHITVKTGPEAALK